MAEPLQKIIHYVAEHGIVRPRDIEAIGFPREYLVRLHRRGKVNRPSRGIYTLPDANVTEWHSYAQVAKRVPEGVICLLSALAFHEITTQSPPSVWIALRKGARTPTLASPSLRIVRLYGPSLTGGIENHKIEGVPGPCLFRREDRCRLFQISEQNRTRCCNRSSQGLSSPKKSQCQRSLPLRQNLPSQQCHSPLHGGAVTGLQ